MAEKNLFKKMNSIYNRSGWIGDFDLFFEEKFYRRIDAYESNKHDACRQGNR